MMKNEYGDTKVDTTDLQEVKYVPIDGKNIEKFQPDQEHKKSDTWYLRFVVFTGILLSLEGSATAVWPSPAVVILQSNNTDANPIGRPITTVELSTLVGLPGMVSLPASFFFPKLGDFIGRKKCLQLMGFGIIFTTVALAFSTELYLLITFYTLGQVFLGGVWGVLPIYITEICEDHNRAKYGCLMTMSSPIGQLYIYAIGSAFNLRYLTLISAIPLIPFLIGFFFVPESPVYSLSKGRKEECKNSLKRLRNNKSDKEIEIDYDNIKDSLMVVEPRKNYIKELFSKKEGRIGLMLAVIPIFAQFFSGIPVVMTLLAPIFDESGSNLSGNTIAVIVGVVKVCTFAFTSSIVEKVGRKPLLIISATGAGIPATLLGVFFYLNYIKSPLVNQFQWVPLVCVISYVVLYALGLGPIPVAIMSELFPPDVRSTAVAFVATFVGFISSIFVGIYPILAESAGTYFCFYTFAVCCYISAILFYLLLPETKGKSVIEIQTIIKNYKFSK